MSELKTDSSVALVQREFEQDKLYGELTIKYEAGRVVLIKKSETIKPATVRDNREDGEDEMLSAPHNPRRN